MAEKQIIENGYLKFVNDANFLYNLEVLSNDNSDYKLVEKSIMNSSSNLAKSRPNKRFKIESICRIHEKVPKKKSASTENILVFHGTSRNNVKGILNYGFRPSKG